MSSIVRRFIVAALCVAGAGVSTTIAAPAAMAQGGLFPMEKVSDCNFNLDWPHNSDHAPGAVSSNGVISCNNPKAYLGVETYLYRMDDCGCWEQVAYNKDKNNSGNGVYVGAAAATVCQPGNYQAHADFLMVDAGGTRYERAHDTPETWVNC